MKIIGIECLETLFDKKGKNFLAGLFEDSPLNEVIKTNTPRSKIIPLKRKGKIPFYFNDLQLLEGSDFFQRKNIADSSVFLGFYPEKKIAKKLLSKKILPIANTARFQAELENKLFFHEFLEKYRLPVPKGRKIKNKKELQSVEEFPCVIQEIHSYGSFGTFILNSKKQLQSLQQIKKFSYPLLFRRYVQGLPCGITLVIDKDNFILSSIRLQASIVKKSGNVDFHGIQWIPKKKLSRVQILKIEDASIKLCKALQKVGFRGVVNVDFILTENKVFFIECNPRISGATWHLSLENSLLHGESLVQSWVDICRGKALKKTYDTLPSTSYEGATLDFDVYGYRGVRKSKSPAGIYRFHKQKISLVGSDLNLLKKRGNFFILPGSVPGEIVSTQSGTGVLVIHQPLYIWSVKDLHKGSSLNRDAIQLLKRCKEVIL